MADPPRAPGRKGPHSEGPTPPLALPARVPEARGGVVVRASSSSRPPPPPPAASAARNLPRLAPPRRPAEAGKFEDPDGDSIDIALDDLLTDDHARGSPKTPAQLPPICMFGRYEILGRLAFGGMAEIFLGREPTATGASRHLVIKRILPHVADEEKFVTMFLDEARLAIQLNHPNICHIYEFGELDGSYFIAMEWVDGVPLGKLIRRARSIRGVPLEMGVRIGAQVAEALDYAHRAKDALGRPMAIVHRDVTPHNVMIAYDGQVKLLDFGIAKATTHSSRTEAGTVKGKFSYMAPEQCLGRSIDGRADVYALGICMWEALTGRALYHRETEYETMHAVIHEPTTPIRKYRPDAPASLDAIVDKALAKRPAQRYQSAGELQTALEQWLSDARLVVNAAAVSRFMERLYAEQIARGPLVDSTPFGQSFQRKSSPNFGSGSGASFPAAHMPSSSGSFRSMPGSQTSAPSAEPFPATGDDAADLDALRPRRRSKLKIALVLGLLAGVLGWAGGYALVESAGDRQPSGEAGPVAAAPAPDDEAAPPDEATDEPPPAETEVDQPAPDPPAPPVEPRTALGGIRVAWEPPVARLAIDGELREGGSPLVVEELARGAHVVALTAPGYLPFERSVDVADGELVEVVARLVLAPRVPAAPPAVLSINTRPWSKVYVGSRLLGTTPIAEARVPSGAVRIRLVDRDGRTHTRSVRIAPGGTERLFYELD